MVESGSWEVVGEHCADPGERSWMVAVEELNPKLLRDDSCRRGYWS